MVTAIDEIRTIAINTRECDDADEAKTNAIIIALMKL